MHCRPRTSESSLRYSELGPMLPTPTKLSSSSTTAPVLTNNTTTHTPPSAKTTRSPRLTVQTKSAMSTPGSKIPRKAPSHIPLPARTSAPGGPAQLSALPRSRAGGHLRAVSPLSQQHGMTIPPASRDKPLPSPPVGQVVNLESPPKAQRTLVDAEITGTPSGEDWPVLRPENVAPSHSQGSLAEAPHDTDGKTFEPLNSTISTEKTDITSAPALDAHPELEVSPPQAIDFAEPPREVFDSVSAHQGVDDSPLAHKNGLHYPLHVPPRSSSVLYQNQKDSASDVPQTPRQGRPGSTMWPLLGAGIVSSYPGPTIPEIHPDPHQEVTPRVPASVNGESHCASKLADGSPVAFSQKASIFSHYSESTGSGDGSPQSPRVKRLSTLAPDSGLGPVLRIASDAEALLGNKVPVSEATPGSASSQATQKRSLSAIAGRISRQMSRLSFHVNSRPNTPQSMSAEADVAPNVKVNPIRSMLPSRSNSIRKSSWNGSSPSVALSTGSSRKSRLPVVSSRAVSGSSLNKKLAINRQVSLGNSSFGGVSVGSKDKEPGAQSWGNLSPKADKVLGINQAPLNLAVTKAVKSTDESSAARKLPNKMLGRDGNKPEQLSSPTNLGKYGRRNMKTSPLSTKASPLVEKPSVWEGSSAPAAPVPAGTDKAGPKTRSGRGLPFSLPFSNLSQTKVGPESPPLRSQASRISRSDVDEGTLDKTTKIKRKHSFLDFFRMREKKRSQMTLDANTKKRNSLSVTGNSLAKRLSANFSRSNIPKPHNAEQGRPSSKASVDTSRSETITAVDRIIGRISGPTHELPDRIRGLQIAESTLSVLESCKQAHIDSIQAEKHARDAELHAEQAQLHLQRLGRLLETCAEENPHNVIGSAH